MSARYDHAPSDDTFMGGGTVLIQAPCPVGASRGCPQITVRDHGAEGPTRVVVRADQPLWIHPNGSPVVRSLFEDGNTTASAPDVETMRRRFAEERRAWMALVLATAKGRR